jgi:hypothetical protein
LNRLHILHCRPSRSIDLLLRANLAPDDAAGQAWRDWQRVRSVDGATWLEMRLLAPLARRLAQLDPRSPYRATLEGVAKASWTRTQLIIQDSASALDALHTAGIDFLLLKGAAYYAEGLASATRRIMGDVDILVQPEAIAETVSRLIEAGWSARSRIVSRFIDQPRVSLNFRKGEYGDLDLHRQVFHFSRRSSELDANLWENARAARFIGLPVRVPRPADSIVISIAHGMRTGDGDWAMDVGYRKASQIEWDEVAYIAEYRGLVPHVFSGLAYLKALGVDVPQSILTRLSKARSPLGEKLKYYADTLRRKNVPKKLRKVVDRAANRMLPREKYHYN